MRGHLLRIAALALLVTLFCGSGTTPAPGQADQGRRVLLGVLGAVGRFDTITGQRTAVGHTIVGWGQTAPQSRSDGGASSPR